MGQLTQLGADDWRRQIEVYASDGIPCSKLPPLTVLNEIESDLLKLLAEPPMGFQAAGEAVVELSQTLKWPSSRTITHRDVYRTNLGRELANLPCRRFGLAVKKLLNGGCEFFPALGTILKCCHQIEGEQRQQLAAVRRLIGEHESLAAAEAKSRERAEKDRRDETRWRSVYGAEAVTVAEIDRAFRVAPAVYSSEDKRLLSLSRLLDLGKPWAPAVIRRLASMPGNATEKAIEDALEPWGLKRREPKNSPRPSFDFVAHAHALARERTIFEKWDAVPPPSLKRRRRETRKVQTG